MFPHNRITRSVSCLLIVLGVALLGYLIIQALLQRERVGAAEQIEQAVLEACNLKVTVEPNSVSLYDVPYWSITENRTSDVTDEEIRITCFVANDDKWQCNCEDR